MNAGCGGERLSRARASIDAPKAHAERSRANLVVRNNTQYGLRKIDELIASHPKARNRLISEEIATEAEIEEDERAMMERAEAEREERGNRRRSRTSAKGSTRKSATSKRTQRGSSTSERSSSRTKA